MISSPPPRKLCNGRDPEDALLWVGVSIFITCTNIKYSYGWKIVFENVNYVCSTLTIDLAIFK